MEYYDFFGREEEQGESTCIGLSSRQKDPNGTTFCNAGRCIFGVKRSGLISLQEFVSTKVTCSSGDMVIALQEVLSRMLQFHNGAYNELPNSI